MDTIFARQALLPEGWVENVRIEMAQDGTLACVEIGEGLPGDTHVGTLLPAPANAHSHAFQRAMAGRTEGRGRETASDQPDTFWTWRQEMFRFLDRLDPDDVEAIAALVQMEMLEAGYAASVEFHYLHHGPDGGRYDDVAEMSGRIAAAAAVTGIGLTLLPVLYQHGGCDGRALAPGQVRFGNDIDTFTRLHEGAAKIIASLPRDARMGVAPHSLRAVDRGGLEAVVHLGSGGPIHMHLAEQVAEVTEVEQALGARPVEWLLGNADVDQHWCLIHCTQMQPHETEQLARTGAVAGLCPITESSLGDGIFDGVGWFENGGRIAVGSDSNIRIGLAEELRTLEYSQRLRDRARAVLATEDRPTGRRLFEAATTGGAQAAGRRSGSIAAGFEADLLALDGPAVQLFDMKGDAALDAWIFAGDDTFVSDVWASGRHVVAGGCHVARTAITARYARTLKKLTA